MANTRIIKSRNGERVVLSLSYWQDKIEGFARDSGVYYKTDKNDKKRLVPRDFAIKMTEFILIKSLFNLLLAFSKVGNKESMQIPKKQRELIDCCNADFGAFLAGADIMLTYNLARYINQNTKEVERWIPYTIKCDVEPFASNLNLILGIATDESQQTD